ncbi:MAG: hypothetical protein R3E66_00935 [bacterium]
MSEFSDEIAQNAQRLFNEVVVSRAVASLSSEERERLVDDLDLIRRSVTSSHIPRIVLLGDPQIPTASIWDQIGGETGLPVEIHEQIGRGRWQNWEFDGGKLDVADLRGGSLKAIQYEQPDVTLAILPSNRADVGVWIEGVMAAQDAIEARWDFTPPVVFAIYRREDQREVGDFVTMQAVKSALVASGLPRDFAQVVQLSRHGKLVRALLDDLPTELQFALARMAPESGAKHEMADSMIRVAASVNATIATIPLPFASSLPITSVQAMMIGGIAWVSGRELTPKLAAEFAGAIGLNVGASFAFRELARALINFVPVAGSLISSSIAAGATKSLGVAARRYFIDQQSSSLMD